MSSGIDDVEQYFSAGDTPQQAQQVAADTVNQIPNMTNGDATKGAPGQVGGAGAAKTKPSWWEKAITGSMPAIMGAAMKQKPQIHAPMASAGHGVQANTQGIMAPFQEVERMADNNPLSNIHQWSNLFG